jgi:hypothetical protein
LLGEEIEKKFQKISLSDSTVSHQIDELAEDIKLQILEKIKLSPCFAICCDESTDEGNCAQLLVYAQYVANDSVEEEILFSQALKTTTTADNIFEAVSKFFETNELNLKKLVGVCTDSAPAMLGSRPEFLAKSREKLICFRDALHHSPSNTGFQNSAQRSTRSPEPRYQGRKNNVLSSRLFALLCEDLRANHKVVLFHTEVRWLTKGNMLGQIYDLKEAVTLFLDCQGKDQMLQAFKNDSFQLSLAYLEDIFEALNTLNLKLQGTNTTSLLIVI